MSSRLFSFLRMSPPGKTSPSDVRSKLISHTVRKIALVVSVVVLALFALTSGQERMKLLLEFVFILHLAWYVWMIFGVFFTRNRRGLSALHILSLAWGIFVQVGPWGCPLTRTEQFLQTKLTGSAYAGDFSLHYLDTLVNPRVSLAVCVFGAFVVCGGSLLVYFVRMIKALKRRGQRWAISLAMLIVVFAGAGSLLQTFVRGATIAQLLHYSVIPHLKGSDGSQTGIASFLGNFTAITTSNVVVGMVRQSDCSLNLMSGGYTIGALSFTQTLLSTGYEKVLHNAAGLTTTSNVFPSGCAMSNVGFGTRPVVYVGKTTSGITVFAAEGENLVSGSNALYIMNTNTNAISVQDTPSASSLTTADINGDGNGDLVLINNVGTTTGSVSVELGKADGSFGNPVVYAVAGAGAVAAAIDDVNNDGKLDIVVATNDQHISVLTGKGDGTFNNAVSFSAPLPGSSNPLSTPIRKIITADVNGDGKKDIICSNGLVLLGNGDGTFTASPAAAFPFVTSNTGPQLSSGDVNKDGKMDLVVSAGKTISVWLGNGDGTFKVGNSYVTVNNGGAVTVTDLDGDGNLDIYSGVANGGFFGGDHASPATSYALMGRGDGTFVGAPSAPGAYTGTNLGDVNGDGLPDLLVPTSGTVNGQTAVFKVELGTSKGTFVPTSTIVVPLTVTFSVSEFTSPRTETTANLTPTSFAVGDVNGDGKADVVYVADYGGYAVYFVALSNGDGTFAPATATGFPQLAAATGFDISTTIGNVRVGDFNHDGKADILFNFSDTAGPGSGLYLQGIGVLPGNGAGSFGAPVLSYSYNSTVAPPQLGIPSVISAVDLNADGFPDLVASVANFAVVNGLGVATAAVKIYPGTSNGTFGAPVTAISTTTLGQLALGDFNKDGKLDIAVLDETAASDAQLQIALGNGDTTFKSPSTFALQGGDAIRSASLLAADFDGDGNVDLALLDINDFSGVFYGKGDGTFTSVPFNGYIVPKDFINIAASGVAIAVDLNKDGKPDILAGATSLLNIYGSAPPTQFATTATLASSANPVFTGTSVTFTATIIGATGSTGTPTGTVTFLDGANALGTGPLISGSATYSTSALGAGTHGITAVYGGDTNFSGSTSSIVSLTVTAPVVGTTTALTASATTAVSGTSLTFTAQVSPGSGATIPTGTVAFTDGTTALGTIAVDGTGKAVFSTSALAVGAHSIKAAYGGATTFSGSTSATIAITITAPPAPDFTISVSPSTSTVTHGSSATTTLSVTPLNGFNLATALTCGGAPSGATCTFSPGSVTPNGTVASTSTVTLQTSGSASLLNLRRNIEWAVALPFGLVGTGALLGLGVGRKRRLRLALLGLLVFTALGTMAGCGHNNSSSITFTPFTSTITLTGTSGSLTHSANWTVTVQ